MVNGFGECFKNPGTDSIRISIYRCELRRSDSFHNGRSTSRRSLAAKRWVMVEMGW